MVDVDVAARRIVRAIARRRAWYTFPFYWHWLMVAIWWMPARLGDSVLRRFLRWLRQT
jgi:hypothetical protein